MFLQQLIAIDLPPILAAAFSAIACAILGNYLVLRRLSLMGDAISHSVLPGIVIAFLVTSSRETLPVFIGAAIAGVLAAILIETIRHYGKIESGASMGVIFSVFFALGVLLLEQAAARSVDLDADCLLHGQLESIFWNPPRIGEGFFSASTLLLLPSEVVSSFFVMLIVFAVVGLLYKELKLASFDPLLADSLGFSSSRLYKVLMILVACSVVASFKVVGSILVIAMIICPAATARLCTDKLLTQIVLSVAISIFCVVVGYTLGAFGPLWLGYQNSINASGMIAVLSGVVLAGCALCAPQHGIIARTVRRWKLRVSVRAEDILAFLYRAEEGRWASAATGVPMHDIGLLFGKGYETFSAYRLLEQDGSIQRRGDALSLTEQGQQAAKQVVRSHRLWESYLVSKLGLKPDHVHETAERLEHFTGNELLQKVESGEGSPSVDPHGRSIPKE